MTHLINNSEHAVLCSFLHVNQFFLRHGTTLPSAVQGRFSVLHTEVPNLVDIRRIIINCANARFVPEACLCLLSGIKEIISEQILCL